MRYIRPLVLGILLVIAGYAILLFFFPPPEKVIRKKMVKLAAVVSENPGGNIALVANANRIASFFDEQVTLNLQGFGRDVGSVSSRNELQQMAFAARQNVGSIKVDFHDIHVEVLPEKDAARVVMSVVARIGNNEPVAQDVRLHMVKVDRSWLIRTIDPVRSL